MSPILLLSLMVTFVAVAVGSGALAYTVLERQAPGRKRLQELGTGHRVAAAPAAVSLSLTDRPNRIAERIASFVPKSPIEMNKLRRRLVRAGYHSLTAAVVFSVAELVLPILVAIPMLLAFGWPQRLLYAGFGAIAGFMLPSLVLGRLIDRRRLAIT